ncbi:MAG: hypothetical protein ABFD77_09195 [Thermotogota bacterium]
MTRERAAVSPAVRFRLGVYSLAALLVFLAVLVAFLPASGSLDLGWQLVLLLAAAGGLGASIHTATSFSHHAGVGTLGQEWTWWFILRPVLGTALGVLFVLAVTGLNIGDILKNVPEGDEMRALAAYLALAGLAGMFSRQAIDWLGGVFSSILRAADKAEEDDKKAPRANPSPPGAEGTTPQPASSQARNPNQHGSVAASTPPPDLGNSASGPSEEPEDAYKAPWRRLVPIYIGVSIALLAATIALTCIASTWIPLPPRMEYLISLLVTIAAALGSMIHVFTSLAEFAGRKKLQRQWLWWYILRPFIAAALGLLIYYGVRAVWISTIATLSQMYIVLVLSLLAGTFSKQTVQWLSGLYDAFFRKVEKLEEKEEGLPRLKT